MVQYLIMRTGCSNKFVNMFHMIPLDASKENFTFQSLWRSAHIASELFTHQTTDRVVFFTRITNSNF